jgi:hypothetical protein
VKSIEERLADAIALLAHRRSLRRRTGARQLRRLGDPRACSPLLDALKREVRDKRPWEPQYQMIMALGHCGCADAIPTPIELTGQYFWATMVYVALGDALLRLGRTDPNDPWMLLKILETGNIPMTFGALEAVALLRLQLTLEAVSRVLGFALAPDKSRSPFFGNAETALLRVTAVAAAGWEGPEVEAFLHECLRRMRYEHERQSVEAALRHEYNSMFKVL